MVNEEILRVGVIGAGNMGGTHARCWARLPGAAVTAVADVQKAKADALAAKMGGNAEALDSAEALLARNDVDAVSVCVPTYLHRTIAEAALGAGKHVLCEKPMALTVKDCNTLIDAQKASGKLLTVGQVVRFFPEYANAHRLVKSGAVGTPAAVRVRRGGGFPHTDTDWFADPAKSGGLIFDLLVHDIDWLLWCFGPIVRVYANGLTERLADKTVDHIDYALLTMRHENGVISHAEGTWADPGGFVTTWEIAGDGGLLTHDSRRATVLTRAVRGEADKSAGVTVPSSPLAPNDDPYYKQIAAFARSIQEGIPLAVTPQEARAAAQVAQAARESIQTGKAITVEPETMIKIGILSSAHMHAASYVAQLVALPNATLAGLWDPDEERRTKLSARWECAAYGDADALLENCDAIVICSENIHHRALTERAAQAGKPILCEKPLATTPDDARAMVAACQAAGVQLMTAFPCRFSPAFGTLKASVQNGDLGEILAVRGTNRGRCPGGWFVEKALSGGGAVMDHTVHVTDLLRALLGSEVKNVYCEADNRILHGDFDDTGFLALTFENGVFATLDASWSRPNNYPTWGDVTLGVTGTKGVMELDMFAQESVLYDDKNGRIAYQGWGSSIDGGLVAAFVHAVASGEPVPITGVDGLRAVEVVEAAYKSAEVHQPVAVVHR